MGKKFVEVTVEIVAESDRALLVNDGDRDAWLPKSQIQEEEPLDIGGSVTILTIPEWLAEDKELV